MPATARSSAPTTCRPLRSDMAHLRQGERQELAARQAAHSRCDGDAAPSSASAEKICEGGIDLANGLIEADDDAAKMILGRQFVVSPAAVGMFGISIPLA